MASRSYAQISCTLPASKKLRRLTNHKSRWAYLCAHLSPLGNYTGLFRYPKAVWADDAALSVSELEEAISELVSVGLIEFDDDEQTVRIISWFHKKNCPENASRMISLVSDYFALDDGDAGMYSRSVSEFVVGSVRRAQGWKTDSPDWPKLRECFQQFLRQNHQDYGNTFLEALALEVLAAGKAVRAEICSLFPLCLEAIAQLEAPPCVHPVDTLPPHDTTLDDTKTRRKKDLDLDETAQNSEDLHNDEAGHSLANVEVLRKGEQGPNRSAPITPLESTKRSRLAMEAKGAANG